MRNTTFLFCLLGLAASAHGAQFVCKDKHKDCPQWKRNMGGDCNGQDKKYMEINCPKTCDFCDVAKAAWDAKEKEKAKNPTTEPADSKVIVLDADAIEDFIDERKDDGIILLEFYAPWCGHCQHVAPNFRDAASIMYTESAAGRVKQPVIFAKFDDSAPENNVYRAADERRWNFTSYPSMFVVGGKDGGLTKATNVTGQFPHADGEKKVRYWGGTETEEIVFHMTQLANGKNQTEARIAWHDVEMGSQPGLYKKGGRHETDQVLDLTPETFAPTLLNSDAVWVVEFYSDKCPICNSLAPHYTEAAEKAQEESGGMGAEGKLRYAAVNSRVYHQLAEPFGITSYPWVTSFYMGRNIEHMAGMGGWESFYRWGKKHRDAEWKESNKGKTSTHFQSQEGLEGAPDGDYNLDIILPPQPPEKDEL